MQLSHYEPARAIPAPTPLALATLDFLRDALLWCVGLGVLYAAFLLLGHFHIFPWLTPELPAERMIYSSLV